MNASDDYDYAKDELREICNQCDAPHLGNVLYLKMMQRKRRNPNYDVIGFSAYVINCTAATRAMILKMF